MSVARLFPPSVRTYVQDFDARARRLALVRGVGTALAVFGGWMLACCAIDRVAQLATPVRMAMLAAGVMAAGLIVWRPLRASLRRRVNWVDAAAQIELRDPQFGQRLVTVASRVLGPAEHRGSDDMLRELLRDVDRHASANDPAALLPLRRAARPWAVVALAALAFAVLARVPAFGMSALAARFLAPRADILPVTSTRLDVPSGGRDVVQSAPFTVEADVSNLPPGGLVSVYVSEDAGAHWSRTTMDPARPPFTATLPAGTTRTTIASTARRADAAAAGRFALTRAAVDRDLLYYVTAGDATSRTYAVRVRRPPAVERFEVRYEYPPHTGRDPATAASTDGTIEAPLGTRATLTIVATEPLDSALLKIAGEKILMETSGGGGEDAGADVAKRRRATFTVSRNARYTLDLISDRKVPGEGPAGTTVIRAIPDAKPLVRLPQAGESLRLHPREILPLAYQAVDDYGVASLVLTAQKNSEKPVELTVNLGGDRRQQAREYELDLASMSLAIGDVVTLVLNAADTAGQRASSEPLHVLVSPRSVDLITYRRVAELNTAAAQAVSLHDQLAQAAAALEEADREAASRSLAHAAALNRANRQLTSASESATLMRQSLFRAMLNSRAPELSNTTAAWIDQAQVQSWLGEDLFRRADNPAGMGNESRGQLTASLGVTRALRDELKVVATGERAAAVLADRENLLASQAKADVAATQPSGIHPRLAQTLARAREDIASGAKEIGLDPAAADLDAQLKSRVDAAAALVGAKAPVDFAAVAREWSQSLQRDRTQPVVLDERLSAGALAEAFRNDADLARARDLQLAATAAARLESLAADDPTGRMLSGGAFNEYAAAVAAVQREHDINRRPPESRSPDEWKVARQAAVQARFVLQRWAGEPVHYGGRASFAMRARYGTAAEELALRAGAESASRNYAATAELDAALARELAGHNAAPTTAATRPQTTPATTATTTTTTSPALQQVAEAMHKAQALDRIGDDQQRIARETSIVQPETQNASTLAVRQREVAESIGRVGGERTPSIDAASDPNWRGRATAAVLSAQERLAAMPQQLAAAQETLPAWREALARAGQAKLDAGTMPDPQRQPAALRTAAQADRDASDAGERFQQRRRAVSAEAARQVAMTLDPFSPETDAARELIAVALVPALQRLDESSNLGDPTAFGRAADEARQSIDAAQRALADAQRSLTGRDPLVSAKWNAEAAADSLARTPPDFRRAELRQRDASAALTLAWDRRVHEAASLRIAALPSVQSLYGPPLPAAGPTAGGAAAAEGSSNAFGRWGTLRPREPRDVAGPIRGSDPPGFEEPLRLYFESLGKGSNASPTTAPANP